MRVGDGGRGGMRRARSALAAALVVAIAASAMAMAAETSKRVDVLPRSAGKATATCKGSQTAVSGGFEAPSFGSGKDSGVVRIGMTRGTRRVTVRAKNFGEDAGELIAYAYCQKLSDPPTRRAAHTSVAPMSAESLVVSCRQGESVISGGFATRAFDQQMGPRVLSLTSKRVGVRRWRVEAFNLPDRGRPPRPGRLVAYAYCVKHDLRLKTVSKRVRLPPQRSPRPRTFRVSCPGKSRAISGGFDGNIDLSGEPTAAGALTSMKSRDRRGWRTSALSISDRSSSKITAYVYCRHPRRG